MTRCYLGMFYRMKIKNARIMKRVYMSLILSILLGVGCSEYKMKEYDLMDRINFIVKDDWGQVSVDPEDMVWEGNFGMTMAARILCRW